MRIRAELWIQLDPRRSVRGQIEFKGGFWVFLMGLDIFHGTIDLLCSLFVETIGHLYASEEQKDWEA